MANKYSKAKLEKFKKAITKKMGSVSEDIETIKELEDKGISGLICGRAIYDNKVNITKALDILGNQDA